MVSIVAMIVEDGVLYPGVIKLNTITLVFAVSNLRTYHKWHNKQLLVLLGSHDNISEWYVCSYFHMIIVCIGEYTPTEDS